MGYPITDIEGKFLPPRLAGRYLTASETNQAIRITLAFERPFPLDLIVRIPHRLHRAIADDNWFLRKVMAKGKLLYETELGHERKFPPGTPNGLDSPQGHFAHMER